MTVKITEMKETDFHPYMRRMVQEYAVEKQRTGTWTAEEALQNAIDEFNRLLPRGFFTPDNHFSRSWTILEEALGGYGFIIT